MATPDPHVLIIGGGSAGALIAQGLKQQNIRATIYEKAAATTYTTRPRDWSMGLHWGAEAISRLLPSHLHERLPSVQPDPDQPLTPEQDTTMYMLHGETGAVLKKIPVETMRRATKSKFNELCLEGVSLIPGKELVDISINPSAHPHAAVTAIFADGSQATGTTLIGCDGASSIVRTWLLGADKAAAKPLPLATYNFTQTFPREIALYLRNAIHPVFTGAIHPTQHAFMIIIANETASRLPPETWRFSLQHYVWTGSHNCTSAADILAHPPPSQEQLSSPDAATRVQDFKTAWANACEPFRTAAQYVPDDAVIPRDRLTHWTNPTRWDTRGGLVTLAGDAAHPMSPHRGQGLNNALADAAAYVDRIAEVIACADGMAGLRAAVDEYDAEVHERGRREIEVSAMQTYNLTHVEGWEGSTLAKVGLKRDVK